MTTNAAKKVYDNSVLPAGILDRRTLPDDSFDKLWDSIFLEEGVKEQLLNQAIVGFSLRTHGVGCEVIPTHGVILLVGSPGTGKTSLARGLASRVAKFINTSTFLEVEPHSLTSSAMGKTQKAVTELMGSTIPEHAASGSVIVLLDEVETIATDRRKLSMDANPVDVHRATDAVLAQLDHLAEQHSNLLFIATSNFEGAIDEAFLSRCDLVLQVPLPNATARRAILEDTINGLAQKFPPMKKLLSTKEFEQAIEVTEGLDGRSLRKMVARACAYSKEAALAPGKLTPEALLKAAEHSAKDREGK